MKATLHCNSITISEMHFMQLPQIYKLLFICRDTFIANRCLRPSKHYHQVWLSFLVWDSYATYKHSYLLGHFCQSSTMSFWKFQRSQLWNCGQLLQRAFNLHKIIETPQIYRSFLIIQIYILSCITFHIKEVSSLRFSYHLSQWHWLELPRH